MKLNRDIDIAVHAEGDPPVVESVDGLTVTGQALLALVCDTIDRDEVVEWVLSHKPLVVSVDTRLTLDDGAHKGMYEVYEDGRVIGHEVRVAS